MNVSAYTWAATIGILLLVLAIDVFVLGRKPHEPSTKECTITVVGVIVAAVLFGFGIWYFSGATYATEFFAGWITEYSLSIDNLFIFLILMERLKVPRHLQQYALLVGIILALVFRGIFIAAGAAMIEHFAWVFFVFGAFLLYAAFDLIKDYFEKDHAEEATENAMMRFVRRRFPSTGEYRGTRMIVWEDGKRVITPMFVVIVALGSTDILFALDSIPAIYGLTSEPYLVFTANVFALMGLRQLYFLLGNLLKRLVYLSIGLAVILGFIGVKLVLHAMHKYDLDKALGFNGEIPTSLSLVVIVVTLVVTTVASLIKSRAKAKAEVETH